MARVTAQKIANVGDFVLDPPSVKLSRQPRGSPLRLC